MKIQPIALAILAEPPFAIDPATAALRLGVLVDSGPLNARIERLPEDGYYARTVATKAEAVGVIGEMIALRERADKYFAAIDAQKPPAVSASIEKLNAVRQTVGQSVADALAKSHPEFTPPLDAHPAVATAAADHESVRVFPSLAWRASNQQALESLKCELRRLGA